MTSLENLRLLLSGGSPEWIPFTLHVGAMPGFTAPVLRHFQESTGSSDPDAWFRDDFRGWSLTARFGGGDPRRYHGEVEAGTRFDEWGIGHIDCHVEGALGRTYPPLARVDGVAEVEAFPSPVIDEGIDTAPVDGHHREGCPVFGYAGSIYEWSWWLRGMEEFLAGMLLEPALTEAIVRKVADYTRRLALASAGAGIDVLCFYDDAGMQTGMQISPELWRRFIKPRWQEVLDAVRLRFPGVRTFLHSCGDIRPIVPDIVELGFDILHPVQPECMDFAEVRREFGRHIVLCATLSSQRILPFGSAQEVRREVRRLREVCANDRRAILCPSNLIQPETPWENVVAFAEEARARG